MKRLLDAKIFSGKRLLGKTGYFGAVAADHGILPEVQQAGWAAVSRTYEQLKPAPDIWQLEYTKAIFGRGEFVLGYADILARYCAESPDQPHSISASARYLSLRSCTRALVRLGQPVFGTWVWTAIDRLLFTMACLVALLVFVLLNIFCLFEKSTTPDDTNILLAVYGEWSNRTRHVLGLLESTTLGVGILVVGRPTRSLGRIRKEWQTKLGVPVPALCRPFSMLSSITSLPLAVLSFAQGARLVSVLEYRPPFQELVGISFRTLLGASSQHWWRKQPHHASTVVYGHTGLADTTMLEQSQQATGASTIHAVHGVSSGYNFAGKSTHALFRCGYDAKWYRALGCYGSCEWSAMDSPTPARPGSGFALFTNLAHPMNHYYLVNGCTDEMRVLADVDSTIRSSSTYSQEKMYWHPHPSLASHNPLDFDLLGKYAGALGYGCIENSSVYEVISSAAIILTTPSTVVLDALQYGVLPIVLDWQGISPSAALSGYPLTAADCDELQGAITIAMDPGLRAKKQLEAWEHISPAKPLSWPCLGIGG